MKKIEKFLKRTDNLTVGEINNLVKKCQESKEKFTGQLIITIDRLESEEKIDYLAELFIMFAKEEIDKKLYFRCCKALDNSSYYDIADFKEKKFYSNGNDEDIIYFSIGLLRNQKPVQQNVVRVGGLMYFEISETGEIFLKLNKKLKV